MLRFEGLREDAAYVTRSHDREAEIPSYNGGKFPLSTFLAQRVREMISAPERWGNLPLPVQEWLKIQEWRSVIPKPGQLLVEHFPRGNRHYMVCYPFEGRLAHQTLGMLLTRRLERLHLRPLGFVANEYALAVWAARDMSGVELNALFDEDMLGDDLDAWLADSNLYKRTFRNAAIIAGLIERRMPGKEKTGRQVTFSSDLIYDVLRSHEPDHVLLARHLCRCRHRLARHCPPLGYAGADKKANRDTKAGPGVASGGAGAAGDFPRNGGAGRGG